MVSTVLVKKEARDCKALQTTSAKQMMLSVNNRNPLY